LRNRLSDSLDEALPEPQSSLAQALLVGDRSHIADSLVDDFRTTGTAHIVAVSGLHIAIVSGTVLTFGAWLLGRRRPYYLVLALIALWMYVMLTGMREPALRAGIMFSLYLTATWFGRPYSAVPSLCIAASVMLGVEPLLLWDVSFQLSFAAVIGIVILMPHFRSLGQKAVARIKESPAFVVNPTIDIMSITLAAIIATFPIIIYHFGHISTVALPTNLLVVLALSYTIIVTFFVAIFGLFIPALSWVVGWVDWLLLSYIIKIVEAFAAIPSASYEIGPVHWVRVLVYYLAFLAVLSRKSLKKAILNFMDLSKNVRQIGSDYK
jgi:competence protein ComEC